MRAASAAAYTWRVNERRRRPGQRAGSCQHSCGEGKSLQPREHSTARPPSRPTHCTSSSAAFQKEIKHICCWDGPSPALHGQPGPFTNPGVALQLPLAFSDGGSCRGASQSPCRTARWDSVRAPRNLSFHLWPRWLHWQEKEKCACATVCSVFHLCTRVRKQRRQSSSCRWSWNKSSRRENEPLFTALCSTVPSTPLLWETLLNFSSATDLGVGCASKNCSLCWCLLLLGTQHSRSPACYLYHKQICFISGLPQLQVSGTRAPTSSTVSSNRWNTTSRPNPVQSQANGFVFMHSIRIPSLRWKKLESIDGWKKKANV